MRTRFPAATRRCSAPAPPCKIWISVSIVYKPLGPRRSSVSTLNPENPGTRALTEVRELRAELDARYSTMRDSNTQAWTGAKERFIAAYRDLADSLRSDRAKPETEENSKPAEEPAKVESKKEGE